MWASIKLLYIALTIAATFLIHLDASDLKTREKCLYKDTVDLSGYTPLENGSYLYQNILIPKEKVVQYDYRLAAYNKSKEAESHWRGCICGPKRYCVKFCCQFGEFFNETSFNCEKISNDLNVPTHMEVISRNDSRQNLNIYEHFIYQVGVPCKHPETLTMEDDKWHLMEVS